jgi:hypothetical protein
MRYEDITLNRILTYDTSKACSSTPLSFALPADCLRAVLVRRAAQPQSFRGSAINPIDKIQHGRTVGFCDALSLVHV